MRSAIGVAIALFVVAATAQSLPSRDEIHERAVKGDVWAQKTLGVIREADGELRSAYAWYRLAATGGSGRGQQLLANAYRHGRGTDKNPFMAAFWYAISVYLCRAEVLPSESVGLENEMSSEAWNHAWDAAHDGVLLRPHGNRPDCGDYFDGETWIGFVYPDKSNMMSDHFVGTFTTLDACRDTARKQISNNKWTNADYECGLDCRLNSGMNVCKKTLR